jgi:putative transposase
MPRRPRVIAPGVAHHVTQRGNNRQPVFHSSDDRRFYLGLLGRHATRYGVRILGYCLMTNHVHLVAVPERENSLARALGCTHSEYALALNHAQGWSGHVWQNRFFSCLLDESHVLRALRYVELNPVRAGLTSAPWDWPWSSARAHTLDHVLDPVLDCRWVEYFGGWDYHEWQEILSAGMPGGECDTVRRATHTGEPLGSREFVTALERQAGRRLRVLARGRPPKEPEAGDQAGLQGGLFAGCHD